MIRDPDFNNKEDWVSSSYLRSLVLTMSPTLLSVSPLPDTQVSR